MIAEQRE